MDPWTQHLLDRLRRVQQDLGREPSGPDALDADFGDLLDSMALLELVALLADDCGVTPTAIEDCVGRRFETPAQLAHAMQRVGLRPRSANLLVPSSGGEPASSGELPEGLRPRAEAVPEPCPSAPPCWLAAPAVRLPEVVQPAEQINRLLGRPAGWLEGHAGISGRRVWADQDPLGAAADAGRECLDRAGLLPEEVGVLLVTGEAPPLLAGLAAAVHHRLDLPPGTPAYECGGACTGFLAALSLARALLPQRETALIVCVEAPSRLLRTEPGPAGEAAALFGDAVAAILIASARPEGNAVPLWDMSLGVDGSAAGLLQVERSAAGAVELRMDGSALAGRAVRRMAESVRELLQRRGLAVTGLEGVVAHGGNGRMPPLLARQLGLRAGRVWSETARAGNLGSASLPVAWAGRAPHCRGPVAWTAVGVGLTWGCGPHRRQCDCLKRGPCARCPKRR